MLLYHLSWAEVFLLAMGSKIFGVECFKMDDFNAQEIVLKQWSCPCHLRTQRNCLSKHFSAGHAACIHHPVHLLLHLVKVLSSSPQILWPPQVPCV